MNLSVELLHRDHFFDSEATSFFFPFAASCQRCSDVLRKQPCGDLPTLPVLPHSGSVGQREHTCCHLANCLKEPASLVPADECVVCLRLTSSLLKI